jgi:hypothetical protein
MAGGGNNLDVIQPNRAKAGRDELGRPFHVGGVIGLRADAGNAQELLQLFEQTIFMQLDECVSG